MTRNTFIMVEIEYFPPLDPHTFCKCYVASKRRQTLRQPSRRSSFPLHFVFVSLPRVLGQIGWANQTLPSC